MAKMTGLGKGLDALFGPATVEEVEVENNIETGNLKSLKITEVEPNREQPRKVFNQDALEELADKLTRTVINTGKQVTLEPMSAYERKIIHNRLQDSKRVRTYSVGEEPYRKVIIAKK